MPLGRYVEKYELNGKTSNSYGSISSGDAESQVMLPKNKDADSSESDINEEHLVNSASNDCIENSTKFRDGKRKIDYILVFEECTTTRNGKFDSYRDKYLTNLRSFGLEMEEEIVPLRQTSLDKYSGDKFVHFVKLSAPFDVLCRYAERLSLRAPLQSLPNPSDNWSDQLFSLTRITNPMYEFVPNKPLDYYTCAFKKSKLDRFLGSDDSDTYFTTTQRIHVVHEILQTVPFGKRSLAQIGIDRLIEEEIFTASFPLHDGTFLASKCNAEPQHYNKRQILYYYWAQWCKWYKYQPLDHIRDYFGEKIAIYFAWLGFYTGWLVPAAVVGIFVFFYGLFSIRSDIPSSEICSSGDKYLMCPNCDETQGCQYWYLSEICLFAKLSVMFDHSGTVFYAVFISFWAVAFLEYWKRKSASLAHHWDCIDFDEEERPRPRFSARAPYLERNPITGNKEPAFPHKIRCLRMAAGYITIASMLVLVLIFMIAVIIYRIILVSMNSFQSQRLRPIASLIATSSGAFVNLILIMIVGRVYEKLAYKLTEWEMHRTQSEFDNQLALKVFIFQFCNFYSSIFYIAFFKGRFAGRPGSYHKLLGLRNEECSNNGCLMELTQQLAIIMIGKQVINNAREIFIPKVQSWLQRKHTNIETSNRRLTRWEQDFRLIPYEGLFEEYLEMILQFGFITIFVAAFPLAPFFALLNNWFEIRLDAHKLVCYTRRPIPERANNIGIWFSILNFLSHIAVISNAFIIAFTSDFLPKMLYHYEFGSNDDYDTSLSGYINYTLATSPANTMNQTCRYREFRDSNGRRTEFFWKLMFVRIAFVVIFEHIVFSICRLIDLLVPDIPKSIEHKIKRERYLAKEALTDSDNVLKVNTLDVNQQDLDDT